MGVDNDLPPGGALPWADADTILSPTVSTYE